MKIFNKKNCLSIGIFLTILMLIGSFLDYQISSTLYNPNSIFGIFFASYGQLPAMLCICIGGTLLIRVSQSCQSFIKGLCFILGILLNVLAIAGISLDPMLYISHMSIGLSIMIAIVIVMIGDIVSFKISKDTPKNELKKIILLLLGTTFLELLIINIIKIPWSRPRMRMIVQQPFASFQPWWIIGSHMKNHFMALGVAAEEFKSFPSGHTGNAACAILLVILPLVCQKLKGKENILFFIGIIFTLIVAFSRIIMGAHFLTDVTIGMSVTLIIEMLLIHILWKKE